MKSVGTSQCILQGADVQRAQGRTRRNKTMACAGFPATTHLTPSSGMSATEQTSSNTGLPRALGEGAVAGLDEEGEAAEGPGAEECAASDMSGWHQRWSAEEGEGGACEDNPGDAKDI